MSAELGAALTHCHDLVHDLDLAGLLIETAVSVAPVGEGNGAERLPFSLSARMANLRALRCQQTLDLSDRAVNRAERGYDAVHVRSSCRWVPSSTTMPIATSPGFLLVIAADPLRSQRSRCVGRRW